MAELLYHLLMCTVSGSIMFLLAWMVRMLFSKKKAAVWYYALLTMSVAMFILPVQRFLDMPRFFNVELAADFESIDFMTPVTGTKSVGTVSGSADTVVIVFCIWAAGAAAMLIYSIAGYAGVVRALKKHSRPVRDAETLENFEYICYVLGIKRGIRLCRSESITSPVLFGIARPAIVIPNRSFSDGEMAMIFTHELIHYRHRDLYIKLASVLGRCLHWFNPVSHIICRAVIDACEACCDETALSVLELSDCKDYGRLLLSVIDGKKQNSGLYSTSMASSEKYIKRRLVKIAGFKEAGKMLRITGILSAAAIAVCSLSAFGITQAAAVVPKEVAPIFKNASDENRPQPASVPEPTPMAQAGAAYPSAVPAARNTEAPVLSTETPHTEQPSGGAEEENAATEAAYTGSAAETPLPEERAAQANEPVFAAEPELSAVPETHDENVLRWEIQPDPQPSGIEPRPGEVSADVVGTSGYIERGRFGEDGLIHGSYIYSDEQNKGCVAVLSDIKRIDIVRYDEALEDDFVVYSCEAGDTDPWGMGIESDKQFDMEPGVRYSYILHGEPGSEVKTYLYTRGPAYLRYYSEELEYSAEE